MINMEEAPDAVPLCPSCHAPVEKILFKKIRTVLDSRRVYLCSVCSHLLPISFED
jgi:hypothetical protein